MQNILKERWPFLLVVVGVVFLVGLWYTVHHQGSSSTGQNSKIGQPISASLNQNLKSVASTGFSYTGAPIPSSTGGAATTSNGKPVVFYAGAEYCPYCASERWPLVVALNRFGSFKGLKYMASSSQDVYPSTSTLTFYKSTYTSDYIDFQPVELAGREPQNGKYPPLEQPSDQQKQWYSKYNAPPYTKNSGSIPFIDVANQYVQSGAGFQPNLLKNQTWKQVGQALKSPSNSKLAQAIFANANLITAEICLADNGQPSKVCSNSTIASLAGQLKSQKPAGSQTSGNSGTGS